MENEPKNPSSNVRLKRVVWSDFLAEWKMAFIFIKKFAKNNSFEADFRHAEVTDMYSESALCDFKSFCNFLLFIAFIIKTKEKIPILKF